MLNLNEEQIKAVQESNAHSFSSNSLAFMSLMNLEDESKYSHEMVRNGRRWMIAIQSDDPDTIQRSKELGFYIVTTDKPNEIHWIDADNESERQKGWYAIAFCWSSNEGTFIGGNYWHGDHFDEKLPAFKISSQCFSSKEEAEAWAEDNDYF